MARLRVGSPCDGPAGQSRPARCRGVRGHPEGGGRRTTFQSVSSWQFRGGILPLQCRFAPARDLRYFSAGPADKDAAGHRTRGRGLSRGDARSDQMEGAKRAHSHRLGAHDRCCVLRPRRHRSGRGRRRVDRLLYGASRRVRFVRSAALRAAATARCVGAAGAVPCERHRSSMSCRKSRGSSTPSSSA